MIEIKLDRNADVNSQVREELGESLIPGLSTALAQKFGQIPARIDKNFWRQIKRPIWSTEKDEKGRDLWTIKKVEILAEVNKLIRRQIKEQSRLQGRQNSTPRTFQPDALFTQMGQSVTATPLPQGKMNTPRPPGAGTRHPSQ